MSRFLSWLNRSPSSVFSFMAVLTVLLIVFGYGIGFLDSLFTEVTGEQMLPDWMELNDKSPAYQFVFVFLLFVFAPLNSLLEELMFRAPLTIVGKIMPKTIVPFVVSVGLSMIFGYIHGGVATIPVQGVLGVVLSVAYLKSGGQEGKFLKPMMVSMTIHTVYNWVLLGTAMIQMIFA